MLDKEKKNKMYREKKLRTRINIKMYKILIGLINFYQSCQVNSVWCG